MNTQKGDKMQKHICTALLAHVDAGKTTLAEAILYLTGGIRKLGRVDHQDAFLDNFCNGACTRHHDLFQTGRGNAG